MREIQLQNLIQCTLIFGLDEFYYKKIRRAPNTPTYSQVKVHNFVILTVIPPIFLQNVFKMYIKISYKFHRIPDTQSRVITKVYDFLGQPSYIKFQYFSLKVTKNPKSISKIDMF